MTTVIVTINKLVHPVKFYYFAVVDCEKYVYLTSNICSKLYAFSSLCSDSFKTHIITSKQIYKVDRKYFNKYFVKVL